MARQTRQQRKARRQKQGSAPAEPKLTQRARARQAQIRPAQQAVKQQTGRRESAERGRFIRESWAELKKVEWPPQPQVVQATIVVLIACIVVGVYLYVADLIFKPVVQWVIGQ